MLLSQVEYEVLRLLYREKPPKLDTPASREAIEQLIHDHKARTIDIKDENGKVIGVQYRITTLGRQAYEECENYLTDEERKNDGLRTAKEANRISRESKRISLVALIVAIASFIVTAVVAIYTWM